MTKTLIKTTNGGKVTEREPRRLIVGISGASGAMYGVRALQTLRQCGVEAHLVVSKAAELTLKHEVGSSSVALRELAHAWYPASDIGAAISSGSFITMGMLVLPCSVRTMSEICTGVTSSLLSRAADVVLKERRRLVLGIRETPLHTGHLRTMTNLSEMGAIIAPIVPALYALPQSLDDVVDHTVGRLLDLFGVDNGLVKRWTGRP
ncbi:4-hydroxy-3-polyprenylbenzoate decarboxylase [Caballeronia udeis]|uniref:Flavin prenyltransferase UbiX n=1 Tax=Caballeronia udeis TaxID=1232866 RepID=A0ABW8N0G9_9BURK